MALRICAVFHSDKQDGAVGKPPAVAVNPPMTMFGMEKIDSLVEKIKNDPRLVLGNYRFEKIFSSRLARALDTSSVLALHFDMDIETIEDLGQMANKEGNEVIKYPGHEDEGVVHWQLKAVGALVWISGHLKYTERDERTIIIVSHRPIIGGIVAYARGIFGTKDSEGLDRLIKDPELTKDGYVVFDYIPDSGEISEVPL